MTKKELIKLLKKKTKYSQKELLFIIDNLFETIMDTLDSGEKVSIKNFGTFEIKIHKGRKSVNPNTLKPMIIPSRKSISYTASENFKKKINTKAEGEK